MELFKDPKFDFLGKKRWFIALSLLLMGVGAASLIIKGGPRYGIDFRGGIEMYVRFVQLPPIDQIRAAISRQVKGEVMVQEVVGHNEVLVSLEMRSEEELAQARQEMIQALAARFAPDPTKPDLNNSGTEAITAGLRQAVIERGLPLSDEEIQQIAARIREFRDTPPRSGLIRDFQELTQVQGVTPQVIAALRERFTLAPFTIQSVEIVGPKIGEELRHQALMATLLALGGMLVYIAFRFEWIYGVAAVVAVFHDVWITLGLFSLTNREISLTVVAALLTLVGYSMNDTIVIFDRVRENLKILKRMPFEQLVNLSVNQTLNRTVLTSGLTFLTVLALFLFGGPVLNNFAFALVVGIIVGTYSSVFIASPIVVFWQNFSEGRKKAPVSARTTPSGREVKGSVKTAR